MFLSLKKNNPGILRLKSTTLEGDRNLFDRLVKLSLKN